MSRIDRPLSRAGALLLATLAALLLAAGLARAQTTRIEADLIAEAAAKPGGTVMLAVDMQPHDGWHGYWLNPGDAGFGMSFDWTLPTGAKVGEPRYPVPTTLVASGLMNHVYIGDYAVLVPLTLPSDARPGARLPVSVEAQWLACTDEVCVPERGRLRTTVEVMDAGQTEQPRTDKRFEQWTRALPAPIEAQATFALADGAVRIAIPLPESMALSDPHLFLAEDGIVDYAAPQAFRRAKDRLIVELRRKGVAAADPAAVSGVLRLNREGDGLSFEAAPGQVPTGGVPIDTAQGKPLAALPVLLLAALAGGLLLNVMPCVFPILSLKALSLARAGESDAQARAEGLAYTTGVIATTLALGAALLALRAAGEQVGWAFQLQEPAVVALLLLLAVTITANFLGLFEIAMPGLAARGSKQGAFATGLLAAFVATPCTGPFMAAAMGAALLLPVIPALALFAALGLGLALPFLAVAFVPALRNRLPRPGPWMETFRRWMALPMGLTALALAWLAWRVGGLDYALAVLGIAAVMVLGLLYVGRLERSGRPARLAALASILIPPIAALQLSFLAAAPAGASSSNILSARPFSEAALNKALASNKPVFAWFTADWCVTCKVNEQVAIEREATARAFDEAGVKVLRGDWTRRDPEITRYLTAHGAAGVPLYVWYPAGGGEPELLPQILTPEMLVSRAESARP